MRIVRCLILWTFLLFLGGCHVADADKDETIARQSSPRNVDPSAARDLGRANGLDEPTVNLTARERQVFKHAVRLEILAYVEGQLSSYADDPDIVDRPDAITSDMLQLKYERDTHRADGEFRGRHLLVTGRVASFKRVHGVLVGVRLSGGSTIFQRPTVMMVPERQAYVTTLTKGTRVSFYCRGVGMHWGSARLGDCVPADAWIAEETERYEASFFGLHDDASSKKVLALLAVARIAQLLSDNSSCFAEAETKRCAAELSDYTEEVIMARTTPAQWAALSQRVIGSAYLE